ncbi:MAG: alpha/beta fold hydrolase [Polyangiaceae bacterium]
MARDVGALILIAGLLACTHRGTPPAPALSVIPAVAALVVAPADPTAQRAQDVMSALVSGSAEAAEANFDATMRAALPPPLLRSLWLSLEAKYGPVSSWKLAKRDALAGKDRFTFSLQCRDGIFDLLLVLEPAGQLIGLFRANRKPDAPPADEPADARVKESGVSVGSVNLPGNLTLPTELSAARIPGVVLVAGSGPSDRDETMQHAKPLRDLAFGLAARGIAVLRFDKRPFARPDTMDIKAPTVETEVIADAVAALAVLRQSPEVDPQRLFVVGHSLGALLTPEIAQRAGRIAGLVLLAAPGRPILEGYLEQLRRNGGSQSADLAALAAQARALPHLPPTAPVFGMPASYWQDIDARDELGIAVKLGGPVLLLRGDADQNVAAVDQAHWLHGLQGKVPVEAATFSGLNHLFLAQDWQTSPHPHIPEAVLTRIAAFINGTAISPQH